MSSRLAAAAAVSGQRQTLARGCSSVMFIQCTLPVMQQAKQHCVLLTRKKLHGMQLVA
jgi:hypothetical protein